MTVFMAVVNCYSLRQLCVGTKYCVWVQNIVCHLKKESDKRKEICFTGGMKTTPKIPEIREEERSPLVTALLEIIRIQLEQIQELRDEIASLKGQKPKPKIKPSLLEKYFENKEPKREIQ